jgi:hypothetical protein
MKILNKINLNNRIQKPQIIINQNFMFNNESGSDLSLTMMSMIADTFSKLEKIASDLKNKGNNDDNNTRNSHNMHNTSRYMSATKNQGRRSHQRFSEQSPTMRRLSNDL